MSSDWRSPQQRSSAQVQVGLQNQESPFMRTAFGYSAPNQPAAQHSPAPHLPQLTPYQQEVTGTPTSVLMPVEGSTEQLRGKLVTIRGEQTGESWFLNRINTSLGRALDNDIVLLDIAASRKHAQIIRGEIGFSLLDLRSANGIFLNGRRITEEELYDGDEIEIGETVLRFESLGQARERELLDDDTSPGIQAIVHVPSAFQAPPLPIQAQQPTALPQQPTALPQLPQGRAHQRAPLARESAQKPSNKQMNVTYGFGSQWSPEDLGISKEVSGPQSEELSWKTKGLDLVYRARVEVLFGQGRTANILRISLAISILLVFFSFGFLIKKVTSTLTESTEPSVAVSLTEDPLTPPIETPLDVPKTDSLQTTQLFERVEALLGKRAWREALKLLNEASLDRGGFDSARREALRSQAEHGLIDVQLSVIRAEISRGRLKRAEEEHEALIDELSPQARSKVIPVTFSLWLHRRELGDLSRFNPPPREQRVFDQAAQEQLRGDYRNALRTLTQGRISKRRQKLVQLREESIVAAKEGHRIEDPMRRKELPYLLGDPFDVQRLLQHYRGGIEQGVRKTEYREIAPWLEAAIILSVDQRQVHQYFMSTQAKLRVEAKKWVQIAADEERRKKYSLARALLQAAIPYLEGNDVQSAERVLSRLKRQR